MIDVPSSHFQFQAGPVTVDSNRLAEEAGGMGLVLLFIILLRLSLKLIGRL